ncbi:MAG: hypothetical protein ABIN89_06175 [Chitinophagaceae bacterium]
MKYIPIFFLLLLTACEARHFDSDKRQIIAKDWARRQLHSNRSFSITSFKEDTLQVWPYAMIGHPIRYTINFVYQDSTGTVQNKKAEVTFSPEGNDILKTEIMDRPLTDE